MVKDTQDKIEFKEWQTPAFWMQRRARRAFLENVAPVAIVLVTLAAFAFIGYIEGCL